MKDKIFEVWYYDGDSVPVAIRLRAKSYVHAVRVFEALYGYYTIIQIKEVKI